MTWHVGDNLRLVLREVFLVCGEKQGKVSTGNSLNGIMNLAQNYAK